jgi:uncharacterized SAM-binding protein YcdF (DUF218 family)
MNTVKSYYLNPIVMGLNPMDIAWTKIISAVIYPVGMVTMLAILAMLFALFRWRRLAVGCCLLAFGVFFVCAMPNTASSLISGLESQYPQQPLEDIPRANVIVVLGGSLGAPIPPRQHVQLTGGADRLWHAARLYKAGKAPRVILTGGNVFTQEGIEGESWYASQLLADWGIPRTTMITETQSRNTYQNAVNTRPLLEAMNARRILLVTSGFHMPRALEVFRKTLADTNIEIVPASADILVTGATGPTVLGYLPSAGALNGTRLALHEHLGHFVYGLRGWL